MVVASMAGAQEARVSEVKVPEFRGLVTYHGLPVPGATVSVTQGAQKRSTVTDSQGFYVLSGLADGAATLSVSSTGFTAAEQSVTIAAGAPLGKTELKMLGLAEMRAALKPVPSAAITEVQARSQPAKTGEAPKVAGAPPAPVPEEVAQKAADGLLINGSVNNAATSAFSLVPRFGNTAGGKSLYSYSVNVRVDNSALDARSYSIAGIDTTKPHTNALTGGLAFQGPIKIPGLLRHGPDLYVGYQRTQNSVAATTPGLVPDQYVRVGDFSHGTTVIYDLNTGKPFANNQVPVSAQAAALLALYPLPNVTGNPLYNYQLALVTDTHQDAVNSNVSKTIGRNNQVSGNFSAASTRTSTTSLFGFTDATRSLGLSTNINWSHTFNPHYRMNAGYQFSRQSNRQTPYWQNRQNVSTQPCGTNMPCISGNDPDPLYAGPPNLDFSGGLSGLYDGNASFTRNATQGLSYTLRWNRSPHNVTLGGDFKREQYNYLSQANPRGTFTFTGAATTGAGAGVGTTGSDVADFLIGVPDGSALSFGNADKYLRQNVADAYATDDWRVNPQLTINAGVRWEYGSPATEVKGRLVNLAVGGNFATIAPVIANQSGGTGFNNALLEPDRSGFEPRIGISYRPLPGSSLLVSAGYGVNYDMSVYQGIALAMAQQEPLPGVKSLTIQNSSACPLTLANGFINCTTTTPEIFGIDKNFRVGYVQTWNLKAQRDLPGSLQAVVTYLGNKGTHGVQEYLPNTAPPGSSTSCPTGPCGFEYISSTGNSTRESLQLQLRRRLKSGLTAQVLYTFSKSIDDDSSLGGGGAATVGSARLAQDWRNLSGERGLSNFDQRHLVNLSVQYTTGQGKGGGTLLTGWRGKVYKEWTVQAQAIEGTGLPETPYVAAVLIAGYSSFVRPDVTGAALKASSGGRFVNPAAFQAPAAGMFGNARRNSVTGPNQFSLNTALLRTFRLPHKLSLDAQIAAANAINHVSYTSYVTNINSTQFGLPAAANAMRTVQTSLRLRF